MQRGGIALGFIYGSACRLVKVVSRRSATEFTTNLGDHTFSSRRDLVKVAQYEVLGNDGKKRCPSRQGRTKHSPPWSGGGFSSASDHRDHLSSLRDGPRLNNRLASTSYWATFIGSVAPKVFRGLRD
jgi:hypothetical protein